MKMQGREFEDLIQLFFGRLHETMTPGQVEEIEEQQQEFCNVYKKENHLKRLVDRRGFVKDFNKAWCPFNRRFPALITFLGGLGTDFPGTSSVKSDFSVLKWTKNQNSAALTNFSLEGILQAKQFCTISELHVLYIEYNSRLV